MRGTEAAATAVQINALQCTERLAVAQHPSVFFEPKDRPWDGATADGDRGAMQREMSQGGQSLYAIPPPHPSPSLVHSGHTTMNEWHVPHDAGMFWHKEARPPELVHDFWRNEL